MNRKKKLVHLAVHICIAFLFISSSFSQSNDSLFWKKPKFFLQLEKYKSFVSKRGAEVGGIKAGLEFGKKYRFGLGYYTLNSDIIEYMKLTPQQASEAPADTVKAALKMWYAPLCFEYIFYDKGKWQFSLPVNLGYGQTYFNYFDKNGDTQRIKGHGVLLTDVVVSGQYKILKWVGVGAGMGFAKMLVVNPAVAHDFNSPLYNLRIKIFLGEIYKTIFPRGITGKGEPPQASEQLESK